jgi:hypothetical protein
MMDDFGLYPREEPFDPLGVMLFKALQVIAFLFFIALLIVSPFALNFNDTATGLTAFYIVAGIAVLAGIRSYVPAIFAIQTPDDPDLSLAIAEFKDTWSRCRNR